ncbi:sensor histidine kinase [Algibacter mikhailovii]|uniref:sensor histidine kinase n=1 Tax=Algibacter mikhailovii TaxID=425498 RepID=UPI002494471F|nr:histidine kinase [Algibacter mikhailovii]
MFKTLLKNTLLLNISAFLMVLILEILSVWAIKDRFDTDYLFYMHSVNFTVFIMGTIWINHFILIPYVFDKKRYLLYTLLLILIVFLGAYLKGYAKNGWYGVSKMFFFLIYTTGSGMAAYFVRRNIIFRRENEEKEKLQKEMELNYLKEQVNPHFLFNSLNSIYALSRQQSPETPEVVMQLSELMRYQLESSKKETVLLKEELEFIENYLLLEEKRLSKRCTVEFLIEGNLSGLKISPMLLITFVENAIKHGAQSTNEPSSIDISVIVKNATLYFCVKNSKPSLIPDSKRKGFGLENVKRRLQLLYPNAHALEIKDSDKFYLVNLSVDLAISN